MVEPIVVIGYVVGRLFALHSLQVALAAVPETVVRMGYVCAGLGVQSAVALFLVAAPVVPVIEVAVMHPHVVAGVFETYAVLGAAY